MEPAIIVGNNAEERKFGPPRRALAGRICQKHQLTMEQLRGTSRTAPLTFARFEFYYQAFLLGKSSPEIGRFINRDHTTVLYGASRYAMAMGFPMAAPHSLYTRVAQRRGRGVMNSRLMEGTAAD
jgi:hypothetical protein